MNISPAVRRLNLTALIALVLLTTSCAEVRTLGSSAIEQRVIMNDLQARATYRAVCDISLGAHLRSEEIEQAASVALCNPSRYSDIPDELQ